MAREGKDLPVYDEHEQGVDQDIREVAPNSAARNARLARYRDHRSALTEHLNKRNDLEGGFKPKQPDVHNYNAVLYLRVSSEEQAKKGGTAEGYSIPFQHDACLAKARAMGLVVVETYVDAGHSAKSATGRISNACWLS